MLLLDGPEEPLVVVSVELCELFLCLRRAPIVSKFLSHTVHLQ